MGWLNNTLFSYVHHADNEYMNITSFLLNLQNPLPRIGIWPKLLTLSQNVTSFISIPSAFMHSNTHIHTPLLSSKYRQSKIFRSFPVEILRSLCFILKILIFLELFLLLIKFFILCFWNLFQISDAASKPVITADCFRAYNSAFFVNNAFVNNSNSSFASSPVKANLETFSTVTESFREEPNQMVMQLQKMVYSSVPGASVKNENDINGSQFQGKPYTVSMIPNSGVMMYNNIRYQIPSTFTGNEPIVLCWRYYCLDLSSNTDYTIQCFNISDGFSSHCLKTVFSSQSFGLEGKFLSCTIAYSRCCHISADSNGQVTMNTCVNNNAIGLNRNKMPSLVDPSVLLPSDPTSRLIENPSMLIDGAMSGSNLAALLRNNDTGVGMPVFPPPPPGLTIDPSKIVRVQNTAALQAPPQLSSYLTLPPPQVLNGIITVEQQKQLMVRIKMF